MTSARDAFLERVRRAVVDGNKTAGAPDLPPRGGLGYQGAGDDIVATLRAGLDAAGARLHVVPDPSAAAAIVLDLIRGKDARRVLLGRGDVLDRLDLAECLRRDRVAVDRTDSLSEEAAFEAFFAADVGVSGVDWLIAETGSVVLLTRPEAPRALSLLPPVHIAVADGSQILPDLFDLFARLDGAALPACVSVITGPSKTGDIELRLVTGVHGPGEVQVVLIAAPPVCSSPA